MNIKERLSFFQEIVQCEYPLHLWRYDPDFELLETNCPAELMLPDIISMLGFSSLILSHIENGKRLPLVLDTEFGLIWNDWNTLNLSDDFRAQLHGKLVGV